MPTTELYFGPIDEQRSLLYLDDFPLDPLACIGRDNIQKMEIIDYTGQSIMVPESAFDQGLYKIITDQLVETFEFEKIIINNNIYLGMNWWDDLLIEADNQIIQNVLEKIDISQSFPISNLTTYCNNNAMLYQRIDNGDCILKKQLTAQAFKAFIINVEHYEFKTKNLLTENDLTG